VAAEKGDYMNVDSMKIIDITRAISDRMAVYPGDPKVRITSVKSLKTDGYRLSEISMGLHTGTHIDAPAHFLEKGETIDGIRPIIGSARVIDGKIPPRLLAKGEVLLIKGRKSISMGDAEIIIKGGALAIGIDSLSIGSHGVHEKLLSKGILIIEGLELGKAKVGRYQIICLPMRILGAEAAPARCILVC
jgi:arylformamidase